MRYVLADKVGHVQSSWVMVSFGQADWVSQGKVCLRMARQMRKGALSPGMADKARCVEL